MHPNLPSNHLGHTPEITPAGMVGSVLNINALQFALHSPGPHTRDDPSGHGVQWKVCNRSGETPWSETECWAIHRPTPPHLRATELGMRVESVLTIDAPQLALHSPGPRNRNDPSRHGVQCKVCNRSGPTPWSQTECRPIHRPILSTS